MLGCLAESHSQERATLEASQWTDHIHTQPVTHWAESGSEHQLLPRVSKNPSGLHLQSAGLLQGLHSKEARA